MKEERAKDAKEKEKTDDSKAKEGNSKIPRTMSQQKPKQSKKGGEIPNQTSHNRSLTLSYNCINVLSIAPVY